LPQVLKLDDIVQIDITGCGHRGEGAGRLDSLAVFIPYAIPGERVSCIECIQKVTTHSKYSGI